MKLNLSFPLIAMILILGFGIVREFDFNTMNFKKPWIAIVYIVAFIITMYFILKGKKS